MKQFVNKCRKLLGVICYLLGVANSWKKAPFHLMLFILTQTSLGVDTLAGGNL